MTSDMIEELELLRYKYLSSYHNGPPLDLIEMQRDLVTLIYAIQILVDPFKEFKARVK